MSTLGLYDMKGASLGDVQFPDELLVLDKGEQAVHDVVVAHMATCRRGTASTLEKWAVAGSGKKPWKQKGTGRARAGYRQSPVWRGGSVVFGPQPRDFGVKVNKKVARLAFCRAFSEKVRDGSVRVLDALTLEAPRTRDMVAVLKAMAIEGSVLFVVDKAEQSMTLSARNIPKVAVTTAKDASTYAVLRHKTIVVTQAAMEQVKDRMGGKQAEAAA